ncbi:MAG: DEAD/DEAH box helicase family protein, partial [Pseudomonadota bacterium]
NGFNFIEEDEKNNVIGLRKPQLGAIHAALSHFSVDDEIATIVMPTGTGKTETMLSILISAKLKRLLVIVPTDALRRQISEKFLTLGVLKNSSSHLLSSTVLNPIVGEIQHKIKDKENLKTYLKSTNVVITTSQMIAALGTELQEVVIENCPYLFIDEAHHSEAPTWKSFKDKYKSKNIIQFTATPFREDEKLIDGTIIFKYSLKKAQEDGYFKPIVFEPVMEFNPSKYDLTIATKAIEVLKQDVTGKHILMARVQTIQRAIDVGKIYEGLYQGTVAVLHSGLSEKKRQEAIQSLLSGSTKIVVCVDMLGEGFDLPELKIAAFHDIKKSLAITLQLAGRFTRTRQDLGNATFIANLGNIDVKDELRTLYSQDPDWNELLPKLSEKIIEDQILISKFTNDFKSYPKDIPLKSIFPATSSVIYKTNCEKWSPDQFKKSLNLSSTDYVNYSINEVEKTLVIIVGRNTEVEWANWDEIRNWNYELYVLTWLETLKLLFIHSSHNSGVFKPLAQAVCGLDVSLITGDILFRTLAEVKRLRLTNIGLSETIGNLISYTGRMGNDVETGL